MQQVVEEENPLRMDKRLDERASSSWMDQRITASDMGSCFINSHPSLPMTSGYRIFVKMDDPSTPILDLGKKHEAVAQQYVRTHLSTIMEEMDEALEDHDDEDEIPELILNDDVNEPRVLQ